jgi:hypothetical protein
LRGTAGARPWRRFLFCHDSLGRGRAEGRGKRSAIRRRDRDNSNEYGAHRPPFSCSSTLISLVFKVFTRLPPT